MKKILKVCLPIALSIIATSGFAAPKLLTYGKGNNSIHFTHIKLVNHRFMDTDAYLYLGTKANGSCQKIEKIAELHGAVQDGSIIGAPAELFEGGELTKDSCAIENFTAEGKVSTISYDLINDGTVVTAAEPRDQEIKLD